MLNQVILVGRLAHNPELQFTETGKKRSIVTLAVPRNFKNTNGEYDTDSFIVLTLQSYLFILIPARTNSRGSQ